MRTSAEFVIESRKRRKNVIFLTGGTGFLGSHIAVELLKRGHVIILLCRPKNGQTAEARMRQLFRWFDLPVDGRCKVIEGQATEPHFGLDDRTYKYLQDNVDEIFHCLAETSFSETKRGQLEKVNLTGTSHVLQFAVESQCYFFHHMSTAYAVGKQQGLCRETYDPQEQFHNAYEETKHAAEGLVLQTCAKAGIRTNIYRPSIVYGDSQTGRSLLFNAFYAPTRLAHYLETVWERDFAENDGALARKMGIQRLPDGGMHTSARIAGAPNGRVNLISIDFLLDASLAVMDHCLDGGIFHLVNRQDNTLGELLTYMERFLSFSGIRLVESSHFDRTPPNAIEKLIAGYMDVYQPYFNDQRLFDTTETQHILRHNEIQCPEMDYELFCRCIRYAINVQWGKKLFEDNEPCPESALA